MKKKIQTHKLNQFGKKRTLGSYGVVDFDEKGIAEVDENVAVYAVKTHPMITYEGEKLPEELQFKSTLPQPKDFTEYQYELDKMQRIIDSKNAQLKKFKDQLDHSKEDLESWKQMSDKLRKELHDVKQVLGSNIPTTPKRSKEDQKLYDSLNEKTKAELFKFADEMRLPKKEWENLNKRDLIEYLIKAS